MVGSFGSISNLDVFVWGRVLLNVVLVGGCFSRVTNSARPSTVVDVALMRLRNAVSIPLRFKPKLVETFGVCLVCCVVEL